MFEDLKIDKNYVPYMRWMLVFSVATNILLLALPLHILQVYSRVLKSGSISTLVFLTLIVVTMLAVSAFADFSRRRIARRLANRYLMDHHDKLVQCMVRTDDQTLSTSKTISKLRTVAGFLSSRLFIGLHDLPFSLLFLIALFLLNVWLGVVATVGLAAMVCLAVLSNRSVSAAQTVAENREADAFNFASATLRGTDEVRAMGMTGKLQNRWKKKLGTNTEAADDVSRLTSGYSAAGTFLKQIIQVMIVSVGALLVLSSSMPSVIIFAAILITNRMLSPVDLTIGGWAAITKSYRAHLSLGDLMETAECLPVEQAFRASSNRISADNIHYSSTRQKARLRILDGVSMDITPGTLTVVTGRPASGKTTLARIMCGAIDPQAGFLKINDLPRQNWSDADWGRTVGYVAQDIKFFPVPVSENITRLSRSNSSDRLVRAAKIANAHEMIQSLPEGYATVLERGNIRLTDRQKVKLALARACFDSPRFLVLDEPDADLDRDGQKELIGTLEKLTKAGVAILVMSRRSRMQAAADRVFEISSGQLHPLNGKQAKGASSSRKQEGGGPARPAPPERSANAATALARIREVRRQHIGDGLENDAEDLLARPDALFEASSRQSRML
ncbi:ATP-binding cassette domain-containing protein [Roseibium sp. MMSF_3412]|uniref:ATP-binding cassette domain-containing protein n=1 Tax=Roseibium sp. MMSF_3412 TaxID=3046712 RepID=UPI00273FC0D6|nr:ATP-binding cassette domain-containing protein [Roseibium sp. MMSF_3412]